MTPRGTFELCCIYTAQLMTHTAIYTLSFTLQLCYKPLGLLQRVTKRQRFIYQVHDKPYVLTIYRHTNYSHESPFQLDFFVDVTNHNTRKKSRKKWFCNKIAVQAKSPFQLDFFVDVTNHNTRKSHEKMVL